MRVSFYSTYALLLSAALLHTQQLAADTQIITSEDCRQAVTTLQQNVCAERENEKIEAILSEIHQRILLQLSQHTQTRALFTEAHKQWQHFRETDCQAQYHFVAKGSIRNLNYLACMQNHALNRITDLTNFYLQK